MLFHIPYPNPAKNKNHFTAKWVILFMWIGVSDVQTDVPAKTVTATSTGQTPVDDIVASLKKWSEASGKSVELKSVTPTA